MPLARQRFGSLRATSELRRLTLGLNSSAPQQETSIGPQLDRPTASSAQICSWDSPAVVRGWRVAGVWPRRVHGGRRSAQARARALGHATTRSLSLRIASCARMNSVTGNSRSSAGSRARSTMPNPPTPNVRRTSPSPHRAPRGSSARPRFGSDRIGPASLHRDAFGFTLYGGEDARRLELAAAERGRHSRFDNARKAHRRARPSPREPSRAPVSPCST